MLYHLLYPLREHIGIFNVLRYLTFRSMLAFVVCLALVLILQPRFISIVSRRRLGQPIRDDGPESHLEKKGTPTMGGLVVVTAVILSTFFFADLTNIYVWVTIGLTASYAGIGFVDDFRKVRGQDTRGVSARGKARLADSNCRCVSDLAAVLFS